jgi:hypothetical protein
MALTFFLRRKNVITDKFEYLFIPADTHNVTFGTKPIALTLPGNDSRTITGSNEDTPDANVSPNIQIDLGMQLTTLKLNGMLIALTTNKFPRFTDTANEVYIIPGAPPVTRPTTVETPVSIPAQTSTATVQTAMTGIQLRNTLLSYIADQSNANYTSMCMGWYNWGAPDDVQPNNWLDDDPSPGTTPGLAMTGTYRIWNGLVSGLNTAEVAGEPDQFVYSLDFVVGAQE